MKISELPFVEHFRAHVTLRPHFGIGADVQHVGGLNVCDGEAEVGDDALAVCLHQDVFAFNVAVGNARLALGAEYLRVEVHQAVDYGKAYRHHLIVRQSRSVQMIVQRAQRVIMSDQP